ncbi:MAG TPA: membrane protein insertase YidC, partial [Caldimonas sp.]|nr:membrane protein insertase YidC [Caldimonas sp.]
MNDIRRTVLWGIFSISLFLIWNAWSIHNGQPSFFAPRPTPAAPAAAAAHPGAGIAAAGPASAVAATALPSVPATPSAGTTA